MPQPQYHSKIDELLFGKAYPEVHKWIDGAFDGTNGRTHWINRHHIQAINGKYPPESFERTVARVHVMIDWLFYYHEINMPQDREEVVKSLLRHGVEA